MHKFKLIQALGKRALEEPTIQAFGRHEFGKHWGGCVPSDRVRIAPDKYYIVNTSAHNGAGIHWVALYTTKTSAYLYDSYNRSIRRLLPHLVKIIEEHGYHLQPTGHRADQIGCTSQTCGCDALAYLMTVRDLGVKVAAHV